MCIKEKMRTWRTTQKQLKVTPTVSQVTILRNITFKIFPLRYWQRGKDMEGSAYVFCLSLRRLHCYVRILSPREGIKLKADCLSKQPSWIKSMQTGALFHRNNPVC